MHPAVVESAVVASPDKQREEVVKAFIVLTGKASKMDKDTLKKELQDFCKENAAPYKTVRPMTAASRGTSDRSIYNTNRVRKKSP